jgi:hypothetical protein
MSGGVARVVLTVPISVLTDQTMRDRCPVAGLGRIGAMLGAAWSDATRMTGTDLGGRAIPDWGHDGAVSGYRVPARLRAFLEARDQTCRFPSCRQPAWRCDMDHTIAYHRGGRTCQCNISAQCRYHHKLKQRDDWNLSQPRPGWLVWRTPARLTYAAIPDAYPI